MSIDTRLHHSPDPSTESATDSSPDPTPFSGPVQIGAEPPTGPQSWWRTPLHSDLRLPAAAAALVTAAGHVPVTATHLAEVPYVGWLFVALSLTCVAAAAALVVRDSCAIWTWSAAATAAAVLGYLLSRGPGLPGMDDDIGDWVDQLGMVSIGSEALVVLLAAAALRHEPPRRRVVALMAVLGSALLLNGLTYLIGARLT